MNIVVVGGGAAGFFGAVVCAEAYPHARLIVLEKSAKVLAKVRVSGGGRCNVTHACFDPKLLVQNYPRGAQALLGPFHRFQPRDTVEWFESHGVALKTQSDGCLFPQSNKSQTIIELFIGLAKKAGVDVRTNAMIASVERNGSSGFCLSLQSGERIICDRLLMTTGSDPQGYQWAQDLGHCIEPPVPSLFTFTVPDNRLKGLAGLVMKNAQVRLVGTSLCQTGPILVTHWGLSGPAILKLSAWGARVFHERGYQARIQINWAGFDLDIIQRDMRRFKTFYPKKTIAAHRLFDLPHRLWESLVRAAGINEEQRWADLKKTQMIQLANEVFEGVYNVTGRSTFQEEYVTCGGVRLNEVNFKTMESRVCPGLYFAGEILDIDGMTGGFNFQNAWTTAWVAAHAMGQAV